MFHFGQYQLVWKLSDQHLANREIVVRCELDAGIGLVDQSTCGITLRIPQRGYLNDYDSTDARLAAAFCFLLDILRCGMSGPRAQRKINRWRLLGVR